MELGIGNGRVESINNKIKVTVRMGTATGTSTTSWRSSCFAAPTCGPSPRGGGVARSERPREHHLQPHKLSKAHILGHLWDSNIKHYPLTCFYGLLTAS